jgi:hypothetical protein
VYDISTICILWFAGASAMAGLLNIVPRYLPRYGMAPQWARAVRPLVLVFTAVAFVITIVFNADVDAQGGAYATGVLVLITSAAVAVTLSARKKKERKAFVGFAVIAVVFLYTTVVNVIERPDGIRIAAIFIVAILVISAVSRIGRSFEIRASTIEFDDTARTFLTEDALHGDIRVIAHEPDDGSEYEYRSKNADERRYSHIPENSRIIFLEVHPTDSTDFEEDLQVCGQIVHEYRVLRVRSGNIPNTIAAVLLGIRNETGVVPHVYFEWTEGSPISNMAKYLLFGTGEIAPVTREVLREAEKNVKWRPVIHVS